VVVLVVFWREGVTMTRIQSNRRAAAEWWVVSVPPLEPMPRQVLIKDPKFKHHVAAYAADEELFFKDFAAAFQKLLELGCKL